MLGFHFVTSITISIYPYIAFFDLSAVYLAKKRSRMTLIYKLPTNYIHILNFKN